MKHVSFILHRDEDTCVEWFRCGKPADTLFVTFTPAPWRDLDGYGFGGEHLLKRGFDVLVIKSSWAHYWRTFGHNDLPERLAAQLDGFYKKRIGYGSSMGGLAVHIFRKRLNLTSYFALSPRFVDLPSTLVTRPEAKIHDIDPLGDESCCAFLIYDPKDRIDSDFIAKAKPEGGRDSVCVKLSFMGHPVGYSLNEVRALDDLLTCVVDLDKSGFVACCKEAFSNRSQSSYYFASLGTALLKRKKVKFALACADRALALRPDNMQAKILRYDTLIASGDKVALTAMYNELSAIRPKLTVIETLLKSRMVAIERRYGIDWLVQQANTSTTSRYEAIVSKHERELFGRKFVHLDRGHKRLIVSLTTHNNFHKYQSLVGFYGIEYDVLFITNPSNSYYLESDLSASYFDFLQPFVSQYEADNVIFFGSSMAGFGALRFAVYFASNAIVCNAQVAFDVTRKTCWPNLLASISNIEKTCDIGEMMPAGQTFIHFAYGMHLMDLANKEAMLSYSEANSSLLHVFYDERNVQEHSYLFDSVDNFVRLVGEVFARRENFEARILALSKIE